MLQACQLLVRSREREAGPRGAATRPTRGVSRPREKGGRDPARPAYGGRGGPCHSAMDPDPTCSRPGKQHPTPLARRSSQSLRVDVLAKVPPVDHHVEVTRQEWLHFGERPLDRFPDQAGRVSEGPTAYQRLSTTRPQPNPAAAVSVPRYAARKSCRHTSSTAPPALP